MDVNDYFLRHSLWPAVLYTIAMMIIGIVGNSLVLIIYRRDFRKNVTRIFIYYLAVLDILSCVISMPADLVILFKIMAFPSAAFCKISRYLSYIFHGSSCVVLMFIAYNRYDSVCRVGNQRLNLKTAIRICIGIFIFVCIVDFPAVIFYGDKEVLLVIQNGTARLINDGHLDINFAAMNSTTLSTPHTQDPTAPRIITGHMCLIESKYSGNILVLLFMLIQFFMYCALVVLIVFFYTKVIWKMVGYRSRQESLFKLYTPQGDGNSSEEKSGEGPSEPLSTSVRSFKSTSSLKQQKEAVCEIQRPMQGTDPQKNQEDKPMAANGLDLNVSGSDVESSNDDDLGKPTDPLNANKLLSRRIKSVEVLNNTLTPIPQLVIPNVDINGSSDNPLLLRTIKTQTRRSSHESEDQLLINCQGTRDDLYLHKQSQSNRNFSKSIEALSPSVSDPLGASAKTMAHSRGFKSPTETRDEFSGARQEQDKPENDRPKFANKEETNTRNETPVVSCPANSGDSGMVSCQDLALSHKEVESGHGRKKKTSLSSVTFSVKEGRQGEAAKRPLTRSRRLTSITSLFSSPDSDRESPFRRSRGNSLCSPSENTIGNRRRMSIRPIKATRTSIMLLMISLAFILSFLPFWIIVIWRAVAGKSFMKSLTPVTFGLFSIFVRSSLVSNAVNPIVYGLINNQFRKRCKAIFRWKRKRQYTKA